MDHDCYQKISATGDVCFYNKTTNSLLKIETNTGDIFWYQNGKSHREDGPAIELSNGNKYWVLNGETLYDIYSQEEFKKYLKLKAFW